MQFQIREVEGSSELEACALLQVEVWGFDKLDVVSASMLASCCQHGGALLGAFEENRTLIGFVFSLPALLGGRSIQHSHMLAVRSRYRDCGVGMSLKMAQYRRTLELGQDLITWTFDPLESKNGHLNLNRLNAVVKRYYVNLYGEKTSSELHSALGTDRFLAEWHLASPPPAADQTSELKLDGLPLALEGELSREGFLRPGIPDPDLDSHSVGIEIPSSIQEVKERSLETAMQWRLRTREALLHYLSLGYQVTGLVRWKDQTGPRSFYQLVRARPDEN